MGGSALHRIHRAQVLTPEGAGNLSTVKRQLVETKKTVREMDGPFALALRKIDDLRVFNNPLRFDPHSVPPVCFQ